MIRQVMAADCGIQFDEDALRRVDIPISLAPSPTEAGPKEAQLDAGDAYQPLHDELTTQRIWWILEILPLHYTWQDASGVWHKSFR